MTHRTLQVWTAQMEPLKANFRKGLLAPAFRGDEESIQICRPILLLLLVVVVVVVVVALL